MNVRFLGDLQDVGEKAWDALVSKSPTRTVFQSWAWQKAWWQCGPQRQGAQLYLVAAYHDRQLVLIMPLLREGRSLKFIGEGSAPVLDMIYDRDHMDGFGVVLGSLKERDDWDEIALNGIPDASPTWHLLKTGARDSRLFPLSVSRQALWGVGEGRLRRPLRSPALPRPASLLSQLGKVACGHDVVATSRQAKALPWKEIFIQHIHRWSLRAESSAYISRFARDFLSQWDKDRPVPTEMILTTLELNDQPVAYHVGFLSADVLYAHVFSFDVTYKRYSCDEALWLEVAAYARERGCRQVVFTGPDEPAVKRLAERIGTLRSVRLLRSRRKQWTAKASRLAFVAQAKVFVREILLTLKVMLGRQRMVRESRLNESGPDEARETFRRGVITRPEIELLRRLRPELKDMRMLEIGIGEGRASIYFAPAVKAYTAFDRSGAAVAAARAGLDDQVPTDSVFLADAKDMSFAGAGAYDLILFSGDGIDEVTAGDRDRILAEVRRVGREGAWFFFSSRNLQAIAPGPAFGFLDLLRRFRRRMLMSAANHNFNLLYRQPLAVLFDEASGYRLAVHYGTPKEQVRALKERGFHDVRVFSSRTGLEVRDWRRWDKLRDDSIYYLCRV